MLKQCATNYEGTSNVIPSQGHVDRSYFTRATTSSSVNIGGIPGLNVSVLPLRWLVSVVLGPLLRTV